MLDRYDSAAAFMTKRDFAALDPNRFATSRPFISAGLGISYTDDNDSYVAVYTFASETDAEIGATG